ncbi:DUF4166 domain-containing protein [Tessaracoccus antarcticus]|uniref:DUF4166 domain-containing protein n=1 Tax=Tessaracoccus antarcticus TaxID=2479848 RepID=A0A3M0G1C4_9ACTN|nr:DUF4166 domain-containing protein [Tessaracoccus antarcticus]RMB58418.1 DUF4166 domain-containing protein [Tessaracoccus antarcticus]
MTSIFERALGEDFTRLHPMMQKRFGVGLDAGYACVGHGHMDEIRRGPWWTVPFLHIGKIRNILIPDVGHDVPLTIENYPYRDPFGRETVTFVREFQARPHRTSRFDATMIYSEGRQRIIDYLGTHQHLAVDLDMKVQTDGSLLLTTHSQRLYEGWLGFNFPMIFSGKAVLRENWDESAALYRIHLEVRNPVFGFLFGYSGTFTCEFPPAGGAPDRLKPVRHECRD